MQNIALIKDGIVQNVATWEDDQKWKDAMEAQGFTLVRIDELNPKPGIDWRYDGQDFLSPIIYEES